MTELWKPIADFPRYEVSNLGSVRLLFGRTRLRATPKLATQKDNGKGYMAVWLGPKGGRVKRFVHHLVLEAFSAPRPDGMEADHINHNRADNRIENLRWVTRAENIATRRHSRGPVQSEATLRGWETRRAKQSIAA